MSSIIEGYNYDIFISYRQKDNKGDRWVSEFVEALKTELESTFKEEISVYFDINPHDGLLETHDVDASLKDKLKCLIFIPIISRTYCDPKSFAWEHEFIAFVELASQDQFGLKVKLPNGNVASRVLPVRIHDLDNEDIKLCESVLGGVLRGIDFIYKESGIDKPLAPVDDEKKNLNNTTYRIQIIKVARAIKEIILGMKIEPIKVVQEKVQTKESIIGLRDDKKKTEPKKTAKAGKYKLLSVVALAVILVIVAILAYPKIFKREKLEKLNSSGERISVTVMPFRNMTNDSTLNIWQDGIQFDLIASLSNSPDLKVTQTGSTNGLLQSKGYSNYARITPSVAMKISQKLDANVFIYGNINHAGEKIRISAQLIDSKTEEIFKSFQLDGDISDVLPITDSISSLIKSYLIISTLRKEITSEFQINLPNSVEAFKSFLLGYKAMMKYDNVSSIRFFTESLESDSTFIPSYIWLSLSNANLGSYDQAEKWCIKVYEKREQLPFELKIWANWIYARYHEKSIYEEIKYAKQLLEIDDRGPLRHFIVGSAYYESKQYPNAIPEFEKMLEIFQSWKTKPLNSGFYETPIVAYHETGMYSKEKELIEKAVKDFPNDPQIIRRQAILSLSEKDTVSANKYIEKWRSIPREYTWPEAAIANDLASIYDEAGSNKKAEAYYRKAVSMEPNNPERLNNLAYFLIDKDRNTNEGLELAVKALKLNPYNYNYIHTKGWGLYKQGKYQDALKFLQRSDSLKPIYDHEIYLHLEAAKKAVANQKNN